MAGSDRRATLVAVLKDSVSGTARQITAEITGIGTSLGKVNSVLVGIGAGIGIRVFDTITDGIRRVVDAIPDLIERGNTYLELVRNIQLETGMSAEQTSTLVGAFRALGAPIDQITTLFARLGSNLAQNEGRFRELGIATRDSNGGMLDAYQIFTNLRRAVQEHGASLLSTAAAQELFGRGAYRIIEALQASDEEWAGATDKVRRWSGVVSQAAIDGANRLHQTLESLSQGITDIGVNIASAIDPYLRAFVDSFAKFVQAHLAEIIQFAVSVVNAVIGFISGLFGITDALDTSAATVIDSTREASAATDDWGKKLATAKTGSDAFTSSIQNQIKAIDAQIAAVDKAAERRRAAEERGRLAESLSAAQSQLRDLRGNAPFLGGLSAAEQALAVQKHAQDIIDAEQDVRDKRQAIGDFEADQKDRAERELLNRQKQRLQERLAAAKTADAAQLQSGLRMAEGLDTGIGGALSNIAAKTQEMGKTAAASFKTGFDAARGFLDILLGAEKFHQTGGGGTGFVTREGGVIGAIVGVGRALGGLGDWFSAVAGIAQGVEYWLNQASTALFNFGVEVHNFIAHLFGGSDYNRGVQPRRAATGGFFPATAGGTLALLGEGGEDEWVIPRSKMGGAGAGGEQHIHIYLDGRQIHEVVTRRMAFGMANSPVSSLPSGSF